MLIREGATDRASNLWRELAGEWADWTPDQQMRVAMVNALRIANWQRTDDATKRSPRRFPDPLLPPGVELDNDNRQVEKFGGARMAINEADKWLGWETRTRGD